MSISRVAVVGAGIIGVGLAREITRRLPSVEVTVFDKAEHVAAHQSGHTSGIVESGLDATPGSKEATLARRGVEMLVPFVSERGIPYRECGQLLIAQNTDEADRLEEILAHAQANQVPGVRLLDRKEMQEIEPNARGVLALYSPHTAVTDFIALTEALASDVRAAGGSFRFGTEVTGFDVMSNEVRVRMRTVASERSDADADTDTAAAAAAATATATDSDIDADTGRDIDDQVYETPRTYHGRDTGGPSIDFRDELRNRFGEQDWFKQVEDTIGNVSDRFSNTASNTAANPASGRDRGEDTEHGAKAEETDTFDLVIVCAGLQADRLAAAADFAEAPRIVPFTSDYYVVEAAEAGAGASGASGVHAEAPAEVVRGIIGSVPDTGSPFSEKSMVRGVNGALALGPNTFVSLGRERYDRHGFNLNDLGSTVGFKGFWKFATQTAKTAARGARPAVSTSAFVEGIQKFVPAIDASAVRSRSRGVRAQAMNADGELVDELLVTTRGRLTMVRSLPRSGATSALAVAEHIADEILDAPVSPKN